MNAPDISKVEPQQQAVLDSLAIAFAEKEAGFLNEQLPRFLPAWLIRAANSKEATLKTKFAVDLMTLMLAVKKVRVERSTHYGIKSGNGFRPGVQFQTIDAVSSRVMQGKRLIAERRFDLTGPVITH